MPVCKPPTKLFSDEPTEVAITFSLPINPAAKELMKWWLETAYNDCLASMPKIDEYGAEQKSEGSADLRIIGKNLAELNGWQNPDDAVCQEMGAWFYLQGKIARLINDYKHHRHGKSDSLHDASVYVTMMRRIQTTKNWP